MTTVPSGTLKDIALSNAAARVLEQYHLDYCCGGKQTLAEACAAAGHNLADVAAVLNEALSAPEAGPNVQQDSLSAMIRFIIDTHHAFTRTELLRIEALLGKVVARHGASHPELLTLADCFVELRTDLGPHLMKEEQILFPYIEALDRHRQQPSLPPPAACFGSIENPIRQMHAEHETVGSLLKEMRRITADYAIPTDACPTYRNTYQAMEGLEVDLMRHIHLENNVLFPRAQELALTSG